MKKAKYRDEDSGHLFGYSPKFRLVPIGVSAARKQTDDLRILEAMLSESEPMYPGIAKWCKEKVIPGLKTHERIGYLAFEGEKPVASAVLKLGAQSKFCHVRIQENFQDLNLGRMIFTQMALQVRHQKGVKEIHFTLPEGLWEEKRGFFASFGFGNAVKSSRQYRVGQEELYCSAPIATVWEHAKQNLHLLEGFSPGGFALNDKVLLSMHPKFAELVFSGKKEIEIRRKFSKRLRGKQVVVYGTKPLGSLMGEATLREVSSDTPENIWVNFGTRAGCTYEEFISYVGSSTEVFALELTNLKPYLAPLGLPQLNQLVQDDLRPPQSFLHVRMDEASPWGKAITIAGLLHTWY